MYIVIIKHNNKVGSIYIGPFDRVSMADNWAKDNLPNTPITYKIRQIFPQDGYASKLNWSELGN